MPEVVPWCGAGGEMSMLIAEVCMLDLQPDTFWEDTVLRKVGTTLLIREPLYSGGYCISTVEPLYSS